MARLVLPVIAGLLLTAVLPAAGFAQSTGIRTDANPLDIDYKYTFEQLNQGVSYRSGADPVVVNHMGEYFLFEKAARMAAVTRCCPWRRSRNGGFR